jgi:hypothetical protein
MVAPRLKVGAGRLALRFGNSCDCVGCDHDVQLYAFGMLAGNGDDYRSLPLSHRKTNLARLLARRPDGVVAPFEQGEIGPDLFRAACRMGWRGWSRRRPTAAIAVVARRTGSSPRNEGPSEHA